jgi:hypothetical protein
VATGVKTFVPAISEEFHLDAVRIGAIGPIPTLQIMFHWDGYEGQFGVQAPLDQLDQKEKASMDDVGLTWSQILTVYLQEDLLAIGREIENAIKRTVDEVTWLTWSPSEWIAPY